MSYLGRSVDKISNIEKLDNITFDGSSSYTLQKSSVNFVPSSANAILISIDGVVQSGNFTVSGSTIDFGTAVASTSTCNFIIHLGVGLITAPADDAVTTAKIAADAVTKAKVNFISDSSSSGVVSKGDGSVDGSISLNCSQNSHHTKISSAAHGAYSGNLNFVLPSSHGSSGQFLKTDGSGNLSFATVSTGFTLGTPVATNSGSEIDFTGIPSTATMIILNMQYVSLSGSDHIRIQIGDSGGIETTGYDMGLGEIGSSSTQGIANGLPMYLASAGRQVSSTVFITLSNSSNNTYNMSSVNYRRDSAQMQIAQGSKTLSGVLDRVRIETTGSNTFDAGTANIMYI